jgi:anti-sigma regulatory factor (Ser/Thr protein kinase)
VVSQGLSHQALIYRSQTQLTNATAAFVRLGLELGDPVLVAARPATVTSLRDALGNDADLVQLQDSRTWFPHPFQRLQELRRLAAEVPAERALRVIHEWAWEGSGATARGWARFESVVNVALAEVPLRFVCLFDGRSLPAAVLQMAAHTHPQLIEDGAAVDSAGFAAPGGHAPDPPPASPASALTLPLAWTELRVAVREHAERLGVASARVDDVVLAVQEVATNAAVHGEPPVRAQIWEEAGELVCQVSDGGAGSLDPHTGWVPPDDPAGGGWGLPIARLTCAAVEIGRASDRTVVTMFVTLDS